MDGDNPVFKSEVERKKAACFPGYADLFQPDKMSDLEHAHDILS